MEYVWVGATDSKTESAWVWPNGKRLTYDRWKSDQPNEAQQQQCLAIDDDLQYQDKERDRKYYYLCSDNAGHGIHYKQIISEYGPYSLF